MEDNNNNQSMISREKLDQAASWVSSTVVSAFFSSLERFSCVNVATSDPEDEEENDTNLPQNDTRTHLQNGTVNVNVQQPNDVTKLPVWFILIRLLRYSIPACLCKNFLGFFFFFFFGCWLNQIIRAWNR